MKEDKKVGVEFGEEVAGKTIVGGRGTVRKAGKVSVPVGIEKVLYLAATDTAFKGRLFGNRSAVLADPILKLDESERAILGGVPDEQLLVMVENIDPQKHGRRKFIRSVAACAASLAAGSVIVQCGDEVETVTKGATVGAGGVRADVPDDDPDAADTEMDVSHGILPDASEELDAANGGEFDGGSPDQVEVDVDSGQSFGILPDAGEEQ
ncbi:MAG: hypothetical protein HY897_11155 [Deltaproteobacteria bacterium]|nr:hypothetical protein [Deltaproteobacteria bacterium]